MVQAVTAETALILIQLGQLQLQQELAVTTQAVVAALITQAVMVWVALAVVEMAVLTVLHLLLLEQPIQAAAVALDKTALEMVMALLVALAL